MAVIEVAGLTLGWGTRVLHRDLSFEVERGEVFVILGPSGCGKSTLLRHIVGLEAPLAGTIRIAGQGEDGGPPPFGVMFQSGALFGSMTLLENVLLPLRRWTKLPAPAAEAVARARLLLVGLDGFENHLPSELSGGMRKRAGIARAMVLEPPLLFLDEPSAGLDPLTAAALDELLLVLARELGVTLVVVTHELASIFGIATRCIMLDRGRDGIIARGDPRVLRNSDDPRVRHFFNREPGPREDR